MKLAISNGAGKHLGDWIRDIENSDIEEIKSRTHTNALNLFMDQSVIDEGIAGSKMLNKEGNADLKDLIINMTKDDFMERMQAINLLSDYKDYIKLYNPYLSPKGKENPHKSYGYLVQPKIAKHIDNFLSN